MYFAGDVCTIEERPEGVPGIPSDLTGSKHKALCIRPAWYWITMPGAGATPHTGVRPLSFPIPASTHRPQIDRERRRQVPSIAEMDIQALYWQIIGSQWFIPRTLDPTHIPYSTTTSRSSSWVSFCFLKKFIKLFETPYTQNTRNKKSPPHTHIFPRDHSDST